MLSEKEEQRAQAFLDASYRELKVDVDFYPDMFFASIKWLAEKLIEVDKELERVTDKYINLEDDHREALIKIEQLEGRA